MDDVPVTSVSVPEDPAKVLQEFLDEKKLELVISYDKQDTVRGGFVITPIMTVRLRS